MDLFKAIFEDSSSDDSSDDSEGEKDSLQSPALRESSNNSSDARTINKSKSC